MPIRWLGICFESRSPKPIWPATEAEAADLERRALAMQAGRPDPGPSRDLPRDEADQVATVA